MFVPTHRHEGSRSETAVDYRLCTLATCTCFDDGTGHIESDGPLRDSRFLATSLVETILRVKRGTCSGYESNGMCARVFRRQET
jgi:hypothetical protein